MYIFFKDKKSKRSHKAVGIKFFVLFLLGDRRIHTSDDGSGCRSRRPKNMWILWIRI